MNDNRKRCAWAEGQPEVYVEYHDHQWGIPVYDDHTLFEMLILESFHTGLSWLLILRKRDHFRAAFDNFDAEKMAVYEEEKIQELLNNENIVRNQGKIRAAVTNARIYLEIREEYGSFAEYLWGFTDHKVIRNTDDIWRDRSELSDRVTKDMKKRGMKYVGSVTIYAYLQAVGVINDHETTCWCYKRQGE